MRCGMKLEKGCGGFVRALVLDCCLAGSVEKIYINLLINVRQKDARHYSDSGLPRVCIRTLPNTAAMPLTATKADMN